MGTSKGELKFFDIEHLKLEGSISGKKIEIGNFKYNDPINEIYSFDEYSLCIIFRESALNYFEFISTYPWWLRW